MKKVLIVLLLIFVQMPANTNGKMIETNHPYSYEQLKQDLIQMQKTYHKEIQVIKIGESHFGQGIFAAKLGKGKRNIVLIGTHHGREWITSMILMKKLEMYAYAYHKKSRIGRIPSEILDEVSIWFIPMLNPDGVTIQQNNIELFSPRHQKRLLVMNAGLNDFQRWKANGVGIDLNRQYPAGWKALDNVPNSPFYKFYKGRRPLEAKEVKALTRFVRRINPEIAVAYHSAGQEIFWNYFNGKHFKRDQRIAKKISKVTGYKLGKPPKKAVGGGFTDWFITTYHRPAMTIEISPLVGETSPPLSVFEPEWNRNKYVGITIAKEAKRLLDEKN